MGTTITREQDEGLLESNEMISNPCSNIDKNDTNCTEDNYIEGKIVGEGQINTIINLLSKTKNGTSMISNKKLDEGSFKQAAKLKTRVNPIKKDQVFLENINSVTSKKQTKEKPILKIEPEIIMKRNIDF